MIMPSRKILVVYNTCGIRADNTDWYIDCINSFLNQDFEGFRVVLSSCLNRPECIKKLFAEFGDKISYSLVSDALPVNITFNKAVRECVKYLGEFEGYLYVDSGCSFDDQRDLLSKIYESFNTADTLKNGIVSIQANTDEGFDQLGEPFVYESPDVQITGEDYTIPVGIGINLHVALFGNDILKRYGSIIPDVFAAYCTESTFSFLAASVSSKWIVMADKQVRHHKSIDGATLCVPHVSTTHQNCWNNLLCGRDALAFINDKEAYESGLGYEECNNIMNHNNAAYEEGAVVSPDKLSSSIEKYFFLSDEELDYNKINCMFTP